MPDKKTITITVEGGVIQGIAGIPEDVRIVVKDYDVEGAEPNNLSHDENGNACVVSEWEKKIPSPNRLEGEHHETQTTNRNRDDRAEAPGCAEARAGHGLAFSLEV